MPERERGLQMGDEVTTGTDGQEPPATGQQPAKPVASGGANGSSGSSGESSALLEKISRLQEDLSQERTKIKSLQAESARDKKTAADLTLKETKRTHVNAAIGTLGDDFIIDAESRKELDNIINDLPDSAELPARITSLVNIAKKPAKSLTTSSPFSKPGNTASGGTGIPQKDPKDYTIPELAVMSKQEPERYKEIANARFGPASFGAKGN
jgi:hypothetical protein